LFAKVGERRMANASARVQEIARVYNVNDATPPTIATVMANGELCVSIDDDDIAKRR
jgi:hypothetical protein